MSVEPQNHGSRSSGNWMDGGCDEAYTTGYNPLSPQDSPMTPNFAPSFNVFESPAMPDSSGKMEQWHSNTSLESPQYSTPQQALTGFESQPAYSSRKSEYDEPPSGVPVFHPRPFAFWNNDIIRGHASFESPSPLSFTSPSQDSSPTSSMSSYYSWNNECCFESPSPLSFSSSSQGVSPTSDISPYLPSVWENEASFESPSSVSFSSSSHSSSPSSPISSYYPGDYLSTTSSPVSWVPEFNPSAREFSEASSSGITYTADHFGQRPNSLLNINQDISEKIPPYATIIYQALMSVPERKMVLADIYNYFRRKYPGRAARDEGWKNSIRHNLSMNGAFIKEPRASEGNAKRFIWVLSDDSQKNGIKSTTRYRRVSPGARRRINRHETRRGIRTIEMPTASSAPSYISSPMSIPQLSGTRIEGGDMGQPTPPDSPQYRLHPLENAFEFTSNSPVEYFSTPDIEAQFTSVNSAQMSPALSVGDAQFYHDDIVVRNGGSRHKISSSYSGSFGEQFDITEAGKDVSWQ